MRIGRGGLKFREGLDSSWGSTSKTTGRFFAHAQKAEVPGASGRFSAHAQKSIPGSRAFWKNPRIVFSPFPCSVSLWLGLETFLISILFVLGMLPNSDFLYPCYYFFRVSLAERQTELTVILILRGFTPQ